MSPSELMVRTIHWVCSCCGRMDRAVRPPRECATCGRASSIERAREVALPAD